MHARSIRRVGPALASLLVALAGCSSTSSTSSAKGAVARPTTVAPAASPTTTPLLSGTLNVFAAASLTGAFAAAKTTLNAANPGLAVNFNFAGSNTLVTQIQQSAPADVFASADTTNMQKLVAAGLVEMPVTFAKNKLEIVVAAGNPKKIAGLASLAKTELTVVLEAKGVPAGDYTRQVLAAKNISVTPKSLETDVKSAVAKVTSGEADATVAYVTDVVAAGSKVAGVTISDDNQPSITYPIAVIKATKNRAAAQAFVDSAVSGDVQKALETAGFVAPQ